MSADRPSRRRASDARAPAAQGQALIDSGALLDLLRPVRGRLAAGVVVAGLSSVFAMGPFIAVAEIGRTLLAAGAADSARVWWWVAIGVASALLRAALYTWSLALCHHADADFRYMVRSRLIRHLSRLSLGWFARHGSGEVSKAVSDDIKRTHALVAHVASDLASALLNPIAAIVYMYIVDWQMASVVMTVILLGFAVAMPSMRRTYNANMDKYNEAMADVARSTVELSDGIEVIKTFGASSRVFTRFTGAVDSLVHVCRVWTAAMGKPTTVLWIAFSPAVLLTIVTFAAVGMVAQGWVAVGDILPALVVGIGVPSAYLNIGQLANYIREGQLGATHAHRILRLKGLPEPDQSQRPGDSTVQFDNVTFGYDPADVPVLVDVDVTLTPGTVTALVGPSGSGKTTMARLIPRFWDVDDGAVRIGGIDVRDIASPDLLSDIALVFQDVVVLRDTVAENIRIGQPEATPEDVEKAARVALIHDRIMELPQGYDTVLGEGSTLSGGEAQRITIARAFLSDASVVVLDEATAHADPDSETEIQTALSRLCVDKTVLVIAHRLHTVTAADQIVVLDAGRVVQRGIHEQLITQEGLYRKLWEAQQGGLNTPSPVAASPSDAAAKE